jgi:SPX domain protein involved in polyphosphate accumulation
MEEIECELGMWKQRYIDYLDTTRVFKLNSNQVLWGNLGNEKDRISKLDKTIRRYSKVLVRLRMRFLVRLLIIGWLALVFREILLVFPFVHGLY